MPGLLCKSRSPNRQANSCPNMPLGIIFKIDNLSRKEAAIILSDIVSSALKERG